MRGNRLRPDIGELREFYDGRLGRVTRRTLNRHLAAIWPDVAGLRLLGLGFPTPYLAQYRETATHLLAFMPAQQGVLHWPQERDSAGKPARGLTALIREQYLPLADSSVERILLVHELEHAEHLDQLLREIWRVLTANGRLLVVAPNRAGIWSRLERTPFGHGRPFSQNQLSRLLRDNMFQPLQRRGALYFPPLRSRMLLRTAPFWENIGRRWGIGVAGIWLVEADKQVYAGNMVPAAAKRVWRPAIIGGNGNLRKESPSATRGSTGPV